MRDVLMRANKLLNTERHIHVPFLAHQWISIRCCVVLCAERNNRGVDGFFINKGRGGAWTLTEGPQMVQRQALFSLKTLNPCWSASNPPWWIADNFSYRCWLKTGGQTDRKVESLSKKLCLQRNIRYNFHMEVWQWCHHLQVHFGSRHTKEAWMRYGQDSLHNSHTLNKISVDRC